MKKDQGRAVSLVKWPLALPPEGASPELCSSLQMLYIHIIPRKTREVPGARIIHSSFPTPEEPTQHATEPGSILLVFSWRCKASTTFCTTAQLQLWWQSMGSIAFSHWLLANLWRCSCGKGSCGFKISHVEVWDTGLTISGQVFGLAGFFNTKRRNYLCHLCSGIKKQSGNL